MNKKVSGVVFVLLASVMWALIPIIAKISFKKATFLQVALSEVLFSFIFISILILFKKEDIRFNRDSLKQVLYTQLYLLDPF